MREIDWDTFDLKQEYVSDVTAESDFMIDLMSNKDMYDDNGNLTSQGAATLGLHGLNHNTYMYQADDYANQIADIDRRTKLDKNNKDYLDPNSQDVINRRRELVELQRESILAAEDEKQAIKDLVQEGIDKELDALSELIDKKNEALESEKDLYEYSKKVKEQTSEIASLEKQMAAYENDNSEEAKAKIQELKVSLEDAKENLNETEWDKYISDTSALLDTLYIEYETILNTRLDNIDDLLNQVVTGINDAMGEGGTITTALGSEGAIALAIANTVSESGGMKTILNSELGAVGTSLSTEMNKIWTTEGTGTNSVLSTYGQGFQSQQTTTNQTLSGIKSKVDQMTSKSDEDAKEKTNSNKTSTSAKKDPTKENNKNDKSDKSNKNTSKRSEKDYYGVALAIWNGNYGWGTGKTRNKNLKAKGFDVDKVQKIVNQLEKDGYVHSGAWKGKYHSIKTLSPYHYNKFAKGAKDIRRDQLAWTQERGTEFIVRPSDGAILTPVAQSDSILNAGASNNIWDMANSPAEFIKNNLGLDNSNIPNSANVNNQVTQHFENVNFHMPNVHSYNELISEMQKDPKFEKLILAMTVDQIAGKSKLAKNKAIR